MFTLNATEVRKDWSSVLDTTVRQKPQFIKRTRDYLMLADLNFIEMLLQGCTFTAAKFIEEDGSITLSLNEIDLIENAPTEEEAISVMAQSILDYAEDFYQEFNLWSIAPNRKPHIPYVMKALVLGDANKIGACIKCQVGEN